MVRKSPVTRRKISKAAAWCNGCEADRVDSNTRRELRSLSFLGVDAIQAIDIFIRGCYLYCPDFLSQDICFWLGLKSNHILASLGPLDSKCVN